MKINMSQSYVKGSEELPSKRIKIVHQPRRTTFHTFTTLQSSNLIASKSNENICRWRCFHICCTVTHHNQIFLFRKCLPAFEKAANACLSDHLRTRIACKFTFIKTRIITHIVEENLVSEYVLFRNV
ncbi:hypothetical protein Tcan_01481, partial [Toxocara canis]